MKTLPFDVWRLTFENDSRDIWKHYDYRLLGLIGEPYLDLDFSKVFYITDTGRCWDGERYSVRGKPMDRVKSEERRVKSEGGKGKVKSEERKVQSAKVGEEGPWPRYHSTNDIIRAVKEGSFPKTTMMTFHPQRWHDNIFDWSKELVMQNAKNVVKRWFFVKK
jgi:hypothetical protein